MAICGYIEHKRLREPCRLRKTLCCLAALTLLTGSGCSGVLVPAAAVSGPIQGMGQQFAYSDRVDRMVLGWRNKAFAHHAWSCRKHQFGGRACLAHFGHGFCQGYRDVAAGGNGCLPVVPPRSYWSWRYQTAEGQAKVAAWFDGYPAGAIAAAEDGAASWSQIQVSPAIEAQYAARGIGPPPGGPGPGMPGMPGGPPGLPPDELPPGPMGLPPLAPEVKKPVRVTPQAPRLTSDPRMGMPEGNSPTARMPAVQPTAFTEAAAGNPLRETPIATAGAPLPDRTFQNALRSPFERVSVPIGMPTAVNASLVPNGQGSMPSVLPSSR